MQTVILSQISPPSSLPPLLSRLSSLISACRAHSIPILYIQTAFRLGFQEACPHNKTFVRLQGTNPAPEGDPVSAIHPDLFPQPTDVVVTKRRVSGFFATDLDLVLRTMGVRHVVLAGVATSGAVLSTVRAGADLDYVMTVVRDGCWDRDEAVHALLMDKVFPRQATVESTEQLLSRLAAAAPHM